MIACDNRPWLKWYVIGKQGETQNLSLLYIHVASHVKISENIYLCSPSKLALPKGSFGAKEPRVPRYTYT